MAARPGGQPRHTMPSSLYDALRELLAPTPPYRARLYLIDARASLDIDTGLHDALLIDPP
ncbi:hypothetical protein [Nonomuraea zeae]|uniref:Uncharacterized protein n=1 Tax=Nonomuraea zeae TaxID=1642303 RepID=A0A5S4GWI8_9ACTN|nr:hypothetical protein [Nonomuraea zeae]TMR37335.1 hypothetical protein ETD85_08310 [Nonomuraea zeae]